MIRLPTHTTYPFSEIYSEIIDVRSENEFAEDRLPHAINLPILNNEERAKVGTIYKQSAFEARKIGAALVSQNISRYLRDRFANKDKNYSPLIYCWRGGQRSNSLAIVLTQIGWRVTVLEGGYKTYRAYVRQQLEILPLQFNYKILCGLTGTGKTRILHQLARRGEQILDLEKIANHRGSLLGQVWQEKAIVQPSQKQFESLLLTQLQQFDSHKTVWLESESNKIGEVYLPLALWQKMKQTSCVEIQLSRVERVKYLLQEYPHLIAYPEVLKDRLLMLKSRYGKEKLEQWNRWIDRGDYANLVGDLLEHHYDRAYQHSLKDIYQKVEKTLSLSNLSPQSLEDAINILCQ